jgi:hypothetical protein
MAEEEAVLLTLEEVSVSRGKVRVFQIVLQMILTTIPRHLILAMSMVHQAHQVESLRSIEDNY